MAATFHDKAKLRNNFMNSLVEGNLVLLPMLVITCSCAHVHSLCDQNNVCSLCRDSQSIFSETWLLTVTIATIQPCRLLMFRIIFFPLHVCVVLFQQQTAAPTSQITSVTQLMLFVGKWTSFFKTLFLKCTSFLKSKFKDKRFTSVVFVETGYWSSWFLFDSELQWVWWV